MADSYLPHPVNFKTTPYPTTNRTYAEARKERLLDSLSEYLDDDDVGLSTFLIDIKTGITELKRHHEDCLDKMNTLLDYLP